MLVIPSINPIHLPGHVHYTVRFPFLKHPVEHWSTEHFPFSCVSWRCLTHGPVICFSECTYILIHPGKYCGSKILKIPSLDKESIKWFLLRVYDCWNEYWFTNGKQVIKRHKQFLRRTNYHYFCIWSPCLRICNCIPLCLINSH